MYDVYVHVCMYVCLYVSTDKYTCVYYVCARIYVSMRVCMSPEL